MIKKPRGRRPHYQTALDSKAHARSNRLACPTKTPPPPPHVNMLCTCLYPLCPLGFTHLPLRTVLRPAGGACRRPVQEGTDDTVESRQALAESPVVRGPGGVLERLDAGGDGRPQRGLQLEVVHACFARVTFLVRVRVRVRGGK